MITPIPSSRAYRWQHNIKQPELQSQSPSSLLPSVNSQTFGQSGRRLGVIPSWGEHLGHPGVSVSASSKTRVVVWADVFAVPGPQPRDCLLAENLLATIPSHLKCRGRIWVEDEIVVVNQIVIAVLGRKSSLVPRAGVVGSKLQAFCKL